MESAALKWRIVFCLSAEGVQRLKSDRGDPAVSLKEIGEWGFIRILAEGFPCRGNTILKGIGDDTAVIRPTAGHVQLVTTDLLIENVHFLRPHISMRDLGHKALAANLSDIAAMGGKAIAYVVALAVPGELSEQFLLECYEGMVALGSQFGVELVGGDTSKSDGGICIAVTVLGEAEPASVIYRSGARAGDSIYVTSCLGDSAFGLGMITEKWTVDARMREYFCRAHNRPMPHLEEGAFFAATGGVHAMIDISDGLSSDLRHICNASGVGAKIYEEAIPVSDNLILATGNDVRNRLECALHGGEEYCLLLAGEQNLEKSFSKAFGRELFRIGEIAAQRGMLIIDRNGNASPFSPGGYEHFHHSNEQV